MRTRGPTPFERRVYNAVRRIPAGRVSTYAIVAGHIRCRSAQAVGQALKRNPFAPDVPCHRVVASDLSLGGFRGRFRGQEIERKRRLLEEEGVPFVRCAGGVVIHDRGVVFRFGAGKRERERKTCK